MDAELREGIELFNEGRFFESHEILEQFYHQTEAAHKPFIEGLIQLAAAFRLYSDFGEVKGPVRMIHQALIRFENYQPSYLEIRVRDLSESMESWAAKAADAAAGRGPPIPKIAVGFSFFHERS
jgi:predicted metal-dependent hydrolase